MANLKELLVNGVSRFIGKVYINDSHITTINDVPVTENPKFTDTTDLTSMTGTLPVAHGGTGKTSAQDAANAFINALGTGSASSVPNDNDYFISQYVGGGTSNTNYYRRPMNMFWEYIKGKISSILGLTATSYSGSAAKVNNHTVNADVPANAVFTDTTYTFDGTYNASTNKAATVSTVTNAINALDGGTIGTPSASKTLTALSQTNGNISATFSDISIGKSQITDFPTTMTPSSHTHGNIQNGGTLQTNDITVASGDKLVVTDSSDSNKVARTSISFDGSTTTKALTPKGTWESFSNNGGTVTSVQVQATSPVQSSTSTASSSTLSTTISLADGYGDTKNPYASKTKNYVLAAPISQNGVPSFRALDATDIPSITKSKISDFPTTMTPSSHTHGNIQNGGTLQTNDVTIASGDKLVITDSSDSSKVARASIAFDGSTATKALTQKGTWESFTNNTGTVTQITAGTGLSMGTTAGGSTSTTGTINHTNSVTAQTTQALYPIKIDAQGHISAYGNAVTSMTPTSHTHGNLSNDGKITSTATIANGDKLVIVDSDTTAASKITGSSITFDGSTTTKALTPKGTWENFTNNTGTVTSVQVQGTNPIQSSTGTASSSTLSTTISLANGYGDIQNPYGSKTAKQVLAAPNNGDGAPTFRNLSLSDIYPLQRKVYTDVIGTANTWADATFFFGSVKPDTWDDIWRIKYRIKVYVPNKPQYSQMADVMISGKQGDLRAYYSFNTIGVYYVCYYHVLYRLKSAGFTNGYGHSVGVRFYSAYVPTDTNYKRTIEVDILETENCSFDFYDNCYKYAQIDGTGSTNYNTYSEMDFVNNGLQETGDSNDVNYYNRENYGSRTTTANLYRYQFCLTKSDGRLVPVNSVDNNTGTSKTLTTDSFDPFGEIFFWNSTSTYNAGANVGNGSWYRQYLCDLRYSFNCGGANVETFLTARSALFLVAVPQNDGMAVLHSEPLSQTLPTTDDGLIYIYLGRVYEDYSASNPYPYRVVLSLNHPVYWYKNGYVQAYVGNANMVNGHTVNSDVPSNAKFTDTTYESKSAVSGGTDVSLVTTGEKYTWNSKTSNTGTVTSVQVQATSPVQSSTSTASSTTLSTTISLADGYGDTKNPYASKTKNYVLAAPASQNGTPSFRALDASDIPNLSWSKITSGKPTTISGYGITDALTIGTTASTAMAGNTNVNNVAQTATTTSAAYELLFSGTADNTTRNEGARKTSTLTYNPSTKALVTGGTVNGYTLAAASAKGVDTSISENSTSTNLPTSAAVAGLVSSAIAASDAMIFKGTLGTGGTVTALPTTYKTGWTYRVITAGTYAGNVCEIGDLIIALVDRNGSGNVNADWTVAQTNVDGALTTAGGTVNGALDVQNELSANSASIGNMVVTGNAVFANGLTGNVTGDVSGSAGSVAWNNVSGKPTATNNSTTGISIGAHGTGTVIGVQSSTTSVIGVQSSTTTASKVTLGDAISIPNVTGAVDVTVPKAATSSTTVPIKNASATSIPNVTNAGSASNWVFEDVAVPVKAASATTVPVAASSPTAVPVKNETATSIPNVTDAGSGSASLTFSMDETDTKKLIIGFTHTHTAPTLGTPISIYGVGADTVNVTGVSGSTSVTGVQSTTVNSSHVKSGGNGTAPTLGTPISIYGVQSSTTSVTGVSGSVTASKVSLGSAIDVPNVTGVASVTVPIKADSATTVPIKNPSASTFVTGTTHTITDNGHTHSIT